VVSTDPLHPEPAHAGPPALPSTAGAPGRSAEEIRRNIVQTRAELSTSVVALRSRINELTDWRRQIREHRTELIAGAAVAGFVIGGIIALRRRR
jgi:hypothetical protein